jgi:hypothetical protein
MPRYAVTRRRARRYRQSAAATANLDHDGVAGLRSALRNASNNAGLPAGLAAESINWTDLSPRGRAIHQVIGVPTGLGMTLTEIAAEVRASVPDDVSRRRARKRAGGASTTYLRAEAPDESRLQSQSAE